jgi:hypothetical protein
LKTIIIDSGSIITLALNNLLSLLPKLKAAYPIRFCITEPVKAELVDHPLSTKKFKFEALQVLSLIRSGTLELVKDPSINVKTQQLLSVANTSFVANGFPMHIVHEAEISAISAALIFKADAVMIDERTTRYLFENPEKLRYVLSHKLHTKMEIDRKSLQDIKRLRANVKFIRSAELVAIAFEKGLLDEFLPASEDPKGTLLDALLWGLKLGGCAISTRDLEILEREELKIRK